MNESGGKESGKGVKRTREGTVGKDDAGVRITNTRDSEEISASRTARLDRFGPFVPGYSSRAGPQPAGAGSALVRRVGPVPRVPMRRRARQRYPARARACSAEHTVLADGCNEI